MSAPRLVIGTRGSALALWQAHHIKERLEAYGATIEVRVIKTQGDKIQDAPLARIGGKGLFIKEIEQALAAREVDLAVHSMKDVPAALPPGLVIAAVPERADARDVLIGRTEKTLDQLPQGALVGTSSLRRICQLRARRPDLRIEMLRGNVDTRLRRLDEGRFDAIVLAAAGLARLGHTARVTEYLAPEVSLPAIGQGALAIEVRAGDAEVEPLVRRLDHEPSARAVAAERAFLTRLGGSCQTPLAAYATWDAGTLALDGMVGRTDGTEIVRDHIGGAAWSAEDLGRTLAERLLERGAARILADLAAAAAADAGSA
ncbi:MAG TPA: hydroxymethylbilane synthase [Polyangia bacterium]|nr:hydroxymethylbilane synthase [Polyangia bacterium]